MSEATLVFEQVRTPMSGSPHHLEADLSIAAGKFVAVVGPSRSGKSLIVELAAGLVRPESGRVMLLGQDWSHATEREETPLRIRVGTVLQQPGLLSNMTVFNNVLLPLRYHRGALSDRDRAQVVMAELAQLGLSAIRDRFPAELNHGEVRRAAIARALILDPEVLLLDDPVAGLDAELVVLLKRYLEARRARQALTIVAALRASSPFMEGVDRLLVLRDGRVVADGAREAVLVAVPDTLRMYVA